MQPLHRTQDEISNSWRALSEQWNETRAFWNDVACFWFEKAYWEAYEPELNQTLTELEEVGDTLAQAYRALE